MREFQRLAGGFISDQLSLGVPADVRELRVRLIAEELDELRDALDPDDLVAVADAPADLLVRRLRSSRDLRHPIDGVFAEVHRADLAKLHSLDQRLERGDRKVLKPSGWSPPDIDRVLQGRQKDNLRRA